MPTSKPQGVRLLQQSSPHRVAILVFDDVVLADFASASEMLRRAVDIDGHPAYRVVLCATKRSVRTDLCTLRVQQSLRALHTADTVLIPGSSKFETLPSSALLTVLRSVHARGARIVSICTGAFILAATGLLDGRKATTHWAAAALLQQRFPRLEVDQNVLYVDHGSLLTSAGAAAGQDLVLHLIRKDFGAAAAARAARLAVTPLERRGGQAQFVEHAPPHSESGTLEKLLRWMEEISRAICPSVHSQRTRIRAFAPCIDALVNKPAKRPRVGCSAQGFTQRKRFSKHPALHCSRLPSASGSALPRRCVNASRQSWEPRQSPTERPFASTAPASEARRRVCRARG